MRSGIAFGSLLLVNADRPSVRSVLTTNARFRDLWLAQFVSLVGDFFSMTALQTLVAASAPAGGEGRSLGGLLVCYTAPAILIGPFAGVLVDRFDRRRVMIACDLVRALLALSLCGLTAREHLPVLYAVVFAMMSFSTFFEPAKSAVMPDLLRHDELAPANALYAATWSIAFGVGAALGGIVTSAFGFNAAFTVNALSFVISALLVLRIGPVHTTAGKEPAGWLADFAGGLRYMWEDRPTFALLTVKPAWCLAHGLSLLLVVYGSKIFPVGEGGAVSIGLLSACRAIGTLLGPIGSRALTGNEHPRMWRAIAFGYLIGGAAAFGFSAAGSLLLAGLCLIVVHTGGSTIWMTSHTLLQARVPGPMRGRVFSTELTLYTLAMGGSYLVTGFTLDAVGAGPRVIVKALGCVLLVVGAVWIKLGDALAPEGDSVPS